MSISTEENGQPVSDQTDPPRNKGPVCPIQASTGYQILRNNEAVHDHVGDGMPAEIVHIVSVSIHRVGRSGFAFAKHGYLQRSTTPIRRPCDAKRKGW